MKIIWLEQHNNLLGVKYSFNTNFTFPVEVLVLTQVCLRILFNQCENHFPPGLYECELEMNLYWLLIFCSLIASFWDAQVSVWQKQIWKKVL